MTKEEVHKLNQKLLGLQKDWLTTKPMRKHEVHYFSEVKKCFRYFVLFYCKKKGIRKTKEQLDEIIQDCFVKLLVWYTNRHVIKKNPMTVYRYIVFNRLFAINGRTAKMEREQSTELSLDDVLKEYEQCV